MNLPLYTIEHVNGRWELYNTETCFVLVFDTRDLAEEKLKQLNK